MTRLDRRNPYSVDGDHAEQKDLFGAPGDLRGKWTRNFLIIEMMRRFLINLGFWLSIIFLIEAAYGTTSALCGAVLELIPLRAFKQCSPRRVATPWSPAGDYAWSSSSSGDSVFSLSPSWPSSRLRHPRILV